MEERAVIGDASPRTLEVKEVKKEEVTLLCVLPWLMPARRAAGTSLARTSD